MTKKDEDLLIKLVIGVYLAGLLGAVLYAQPNPPSIPERTLFHYGDHDHE